MSLLNKINKHEAIVGVIGLGYVGLPLVIHFVKAGFDTIGFDVDAKKIKFLNEGKTYIRHILADDIKMLKKNEGFKATTDFSSLKKCDCVIICVPTPLGNHNEPDLSFVMDTTRTIARYLRKGQLIVLESTTYPGTTDQDIKCILETNGMTAGQDFYLAFSPERDDPTNKQFSLSMIPKIVGGYTQDCLLVANALYSAIVSKTVPVSSTRVAEAAELLENIYRVVNIAMVNELKVLFRKMDIDIFEVIDAAKTKPFGFQAFYPGPGVGGHCVPSNSFYLTWKAREFGFHTRFIELAGEINTNMPNYVVEQILRALSMKKKTVQSARVLVLGLAYKRDIDDERGSPSLKIIELLTDLGAHVDFNDPYIPRTNKMRHHKIKKSSVPVTEKTLKSYDCVVIATDHSCYDYELILKHASLVVDTRNATKGFKNKGNLVKA